jgi:hypothetical protein
MMAFRHADAIITLPRQLSLLIFRYIIIADIDIAISYAIFIAFHAAFARLRQLIRWPRFRHYFAMPPFGAIFAIDFHAAIFAIHYAIISISSPALRYC